jgi:hypothetical protein
MARGGIIAGIIGLFGCAFALVNLAIAQAPSPTGFTGNPLVSQGQHEMAGGNPPAASSGCGTGYVIEGTDTAGHIVLGTGTSQPCTLTFAQPFLAGPTCVVTAETFTASYGRTLTALNLTSLVDSQRVNWICFARPPG